MKQRQKHWPWMSLLLQQLLQLCHKAPRLPVLWNPITLYITTSAVLAAEPFSELGRETSGRLQKSFSMLCLQKLGACLYNTKAANWAVTQGRSFPTVHETFFFTWALSLQIFTLCLFYKDHSRAPAGAPPNPLSIPSSWFSREVECCSKLLFCFWSSQWERQTNKQKKNNENTGTGV